MKLVFLLEKKTAKISSHRRFQSVRAAKICSRKPQEHCQSAKEKSCKNFMLHDNQERVLYR